MKKKSKIFILTFIIAIFGALTKEIISTDALNVFTNSGLSAREKAEFISEQVVAGLKKDVRDIVGLINPDVGYTDAEIARSEEIAAIVAQAQPVDPDTLPQETEAEKETWAYYQTLDAITNTVKVDAFIINKIYFTNKGDIYIDATTITPDEKGKYKDESVKNELFKINAIGFEGKTSFEYAEFIKSNGGRIAIEQSPIAEKSELNKELLDSIVEQSESLSGLIDSGYEMSILDCFASWNNDNNYIILEFYNKETNDKKIMQVMRIISADRTRINEVSMADLSNIQVVTLSITKETMEAIEKDNQKGYIDLSDAELCAEINGREKVL